eukprot:superscaffoldBa00002889_g15574
MCSVPGCKGYKKARSRGVVFHSLPTRDPGRCRKWLKAIQNPKFDENTPVAKYGEHSQHSCRGMHLSGFRFQCGHRVKQDLCVNFRSQYIVTSFFLGCSRYWCGYCVTFALRTSSYCLRSSEHLIPIPSSS